MQLEDPTPTHFGEGPLRGKTVVLTGTLESLTRDEAKLAVEQAGGKVSSSLSRRTDFPVAGTEPGSKHERARALGVETLDEGEFLRRLGRVPLH